MARPAVLRDLCLYTLLAVSAVLFIAALAPYAIAVPGDLGNPVLSPRFLPNVLAGAVGGLALFGVLRSALLLRRPTPPLPAAASVPETASDSDVPDSDAPDSDASNRGGLWDKLRPLLAFAILCLSYPFSGLFGMTPVSILILALLLWLGGERRAWPYLAVAIALPCAIAYFFEAMLNVPVPAATFLR